MRPLRTILAAGLLRYVRAAPPTSGSDDASRTRVWFILDTAWGMGGTIRAVFNLAGHLAQRHEVQIISVRRTANEPFFRFPRGVEVVSLDDRRPTVAGPPYLRVLRRALKAVPSVLADPADPVAAHFNLWVDLRLVRRLRRRSGFLIGTRPGINALVASLAPPGMVLVGQDHMNLGAYDGALQAAIWRAYPSLDAVVVLTEGDRAVYAERLARGPRVARIPNAARDLGPGRADLDAKLVVSAGRLTRQKGYDLLIPAFEQVLAKHPDWRLRVIGRGRERAALAALIEQRGLEGAVRLARPSKNLGPQLERASIYALSSRFEGLPLVLIEAMSKGMAVVSTDCPGGPAEIVEHRRNGILVASKDVDALAAGLLELIEDPDLRRRCAAAAVQTARRYAPEEVGATWEALLGDLWAARARASG